MCETDHRVQWLAGGAALEITPSGQPYLCGYPHVDRLATGVSDRLFASACCFESSAGGLCIFVACDVLQLSCGLVKRAREAIVKQVSERGGPAMGMESVMVTATHTHSGPLMLRMLSHCDDPHVPDLDEQYLAFVERAIVDAGVRAFDQRRPATLTFGCAGGAGLGANRHDPDGPSIPRVPVIAAREADGDALIAVMAVCSMHPTVLHEDSTLISGDFPGLAREWLAENVLPSGCPFVYHMGASGNQSPRHVVQANTLAEAGRLGEILGKTICAAMASAVPVQPTEVECFRRLVDLPIRSFLGIKEAAARVQAAEAHLLSCKKNAVPRAEMRTAEVDWFGSVKALTLAKAAAKGMVGEAVQERMPAEVQVIRLGEFVLVGWPGEVFVEFAIELMRHEPGAVVITLANGELHGYLVTQEAIDRGSYEASHGIFASPESGCELVRQSLDLMRHI